MELIFPHTVVYSNRRDVPLQDIARSLIAIADIAERLPAAFEKMFDGLTIDRIDVQLIGISRSSYHEDYVFKVIAKQAERLLERVAERTGLTILSEKKEALSVLILALLLIGAAWGITKLSSRPSIHIENLRIQTVERAAEILEISPHDFQRAVDETLSEKGRKALGRSASDFFAPAKREDQAVITSGGIQIPREAINEVPLPEMLELIEEVEPTRFLEKQKIILRALDRDSAKTGWRCVIDGLSDRRVKLRIAPNIPLDRLWRQEEVVGDVMVRFRQTADGSEIPIEADLYRLDDDPPQVATQ